jgi:2-iminobutanoate/2-iminopropanoate deaminase
MKKIFLTSEAPAPIGPYSQAVQSGKTLFISGQIALDPSSGEVIRTSIEDETHQVLKNIRAILLAAGMDLEDVVSCTVFITDMDLFSRVNAVYSTYFTSDPPARALVQVVALPAKVNIEISAMARNGKSD